MLTKIYIDNFKCFSNFELSFERINLLLGINGAGKSTLFEVLHKLQAFTNFGEKVDNLFFSSQLTRWQKSTSQKFELEITGNGGVYRYELSVQHNLSRQIARVDFERLWFNGAPLLKFELKDGNAEVQLYRDDHSEGPNFPFDWTQSAVNSVPSRHDNQKLTWFRERLAKTIIVKPTAPMLEPESEQEAMYLNADMSNFVSWYRYISQDQGLAYEIAKILQEVLSGFHSFRFTEAGERHRILYAGFSLNGDRRQLINYRLDELSDGQRTLVALYTMLEYAKTGDYTLCIDEPDNYLALQEIQPWLTTLYDYCQAGDLQTLLISHNPEFINYLTATSGILLDRDTNGPVRAKRPETIHADGVSVAELVARGWLNG